MRRALSVDASLTIPSREFEVSFARSSGPGGQHVQKASTKACLRWFVSESESISEALRRRFLEKFQARLSKEGAIVITSDRYRSRERNVHDCFERLRAMILSVRHPPKKRKKTKPSLAAKERRIFEKKRRSEIKRSRREH